VGSILHARRRPALGWGYGRIPIIGAVVATGGGLHAAGYCLEKQSRLDASSLR
jgi:hypothetical protein